MRDPKYYHPLIRVPLTIIALVCISPIYLAVEGWSAIKKFFRKRFKKRPKNTFNETLEK